MMGWCGLQSMRQDEDDKHDKIGTGKVQVRKLYMIIMEFVIDVTIHLVNVI